MLNRSESKYFATAAKMDTAFLHILEKKNFEYITVKEICEKAGVNRSTFYLHYENIGDLLSESVEYIINQFRAYMQTSTEDFITKLSDCPLDELYLVTPKYLTPYLNYIKDNKRLFKTVLQNSSALRLENSYAGLTKYVLTPILERYGIAEHNRKYIMTFYIHGLMAIINEWLKDECITPVEQIIEVMQTCVVNDEKKYSDGKGF